MSKYENINPNPKGKNVGDCTVRAISLATEQDWEKVYLDLCIQGYMMSDMPSSNDVWGKYLTERGWQFESMMGEASREEREVIQSALEKLKSM